MKKTIMIVVLVILAVAVLFFINNKNGGKLVSPVSLQAVKSSPTPMPLATPNAPKTFQFDASTDLKQELQKINPQVLDSDFE